MSKQEKVVVILKVYADDLKQKLRDRYGVDNVTYFESITDDNKDLVQSKLKECTGVLIGHTLKAGIEFLELVPNARVVSTSAVGYDNIDVEYLTKRGVYVMHTPTVLTETVADLTLSLMLSTSRRIVELDGYVRRGEWNAPVTPTHFGLDLHHKTVGIVGMGRIGKQVAKRCQLGFSMNVLYINSKSSSPSSPLLSTTTLTSTIEQETMELENSELKIKVGKCNSLETLLGNSDFVVVCLPGNQSTRHMFSTNQFQQMKKTGIFINIGRGSVVDEDALVEALKQNTIASAGLDVFETEPLPSTSPLIKLPNIVLIPHIGSATHETRYGMASCATDNIISALSNTITVNCVNYNDINK